MTVAAIKKLKQRIRELERKEAQSRKKLATAMQHAEKLARVYKSRLKSSISQLKVKHAFETALAYARAACNMERKMLKQAEVKGKKMMGEMVKLNKQEIIKIIRGFAKRGRKTGTSSRQRGKAAKSRRMK